MGEKPIRMDSNKVGEFGENLVEISLRSLLGPMHPIERNKRFSQNGPKFKNTYVDFFTIFPGYWDGLIISVKTSSGTGAGNDRVYYHINEEIVHCPYPTVLIMLGGSWENGGQNWKEYARSKVDGVHFVAVFFDIMDFWEWGHMQKVRYGLQAPAPQPIPRRNGSVPHVENGYTLPLNFYSSAPQK